MKNGWIDNEYWGTLEHYVDDELHSINDEPAVIWTIGLKVWYKEGNHHREFGPARIWPDGEKEYWFEDKRYPEITSDLEWLMKVEELKKALDKKKELC